MKASPIATLVIFLLMATAAPAQQSSAQPNDIPIELARENDFVVKMMDVIDKSGRKITDFTELNSFDVKEKQFVLKTSKGKLQKMPARDIKKIAYVRLRQGVLTGKSPKLRVIAWNGKIVTFELPYRDVRIVDGYLRLNRDVFSGHFAASDMLRAGSSEWSDKFYSFWKRKEAQAPDEFAANFEFKNGKGAISRKMAAEYCNSCLKIEILTMQLDPKTETIRIRCKNVFYDRYME